VLHSSDRNNCSVCVRRYTFVAKIVLCAWVFNVIQLSLMKSIRQSIVDGRFPQFVNEFMSARFPPGKIPSWVVDALASVNIRLEFDPAANECS
jgi:hypothetical protein